MWLFNVVLKLLSVYSVVCRVCGVTSENDLRRCVTHGVAAFTGCFLAVDEDLPTFSSKYYLRHLILDLYLEYT